MKHDLEKKVKVSKLINSDEKLLAVVRRIKFLKLTGMADEKIEETIKSLNLPLRYHMFILGNYSMIMDLK